METQTACRDLQGEKVKCWWLKGYSLAGWCHKKQLAVTKRKHVNILVCWCN